MQDTEHVLILDAIADIKTDTEELRKVLLGNGNWENSLVAKHVRLEESVTTCQAQRAENERDEVNSRRAYVIAGISAGVAVIAMILSIIF